MTTIAQAKQRCSWCMTPLQLRDGLVISRTTKGGREVHACCLEEANRMERPVTAQPPDGTVQGLTPRRPPHA